MNIKSKRLFQTCLKINNEKNKSKGKNIPNVRELKGGGASSGWLLILVSSKRLNNWIWIIPDSYADWLIFCVHWAGKRRWRLAGLLFVSGSMRIKMLQLLRCDLATFCWIYTHFFKLWCSGVVSVAVQWKSKTNTTVSVDCVKRVNLRVSPLYCTSFSSLH